MGRHRRHEPLPGVHTVVQALDCEESMRMALEIIVSVLLGMLLGVFATALIVAGRDGR